MSRIIFASLAALLPLSLAWGALAGGDLPEEGAFYDTSCDIRVVRDGGNLTLEGLVFSSVPASGSYELRISQGGYAGGANIHQSGDFDAAPGIDSSLGIVSLPGRGGYTATLTVHWFDGGPDCKRRVGTRRHL